ncbi:hypothetical protein J6590_009201 [Homalodisca vitripennis]|nr:hypothetical protein J6590_009201 [Homalodisca vitripennis]
MSEVDDLGPEGELMIISDEEEERRMPFNPASYGLNDTFKLTLPQAVLMNLLRGLEGNGEEGRGGSVSGGGVSSVSVSGGSVSGVSENEPSPTVVCVLCLDNLFTLILSAAGTDSSLITYNCYLSSPGHGSVLHKISCSVGRIE